MESQTEKTMASESTRHNFPHDADPSASTASRPMLDPPPRRILVKEVNLPATGELNDQVKRELANMIGHELD